MFNAILVVFLVVAVFSAVGCVFLFYSAQAQARR
jgi:hypothetical protein